MKSLLLLFSLFGVSFGLPPNQRVFGGSTASPGQFPFIASLNNPDQFCDGAIVSEKLVLTAAHCLDQVTPDATVLVGTNFQHSGGTKYNISKTIKHENFNSTTSKNDLGLIQIDGTFEISESVQIIEFGDPEINATCEGAGWGSTEISSFPEELRFIELVALSLEDCRTIIGDRDPFYLGDEQVCGYGPAGIGMCFGDSGGPLVCGGKLAGVVSYSVSACAKGLPDVYTRPSAYADWIKTNIQ